MGTFGRERQGDLTAQFKPKGMNIPPREARSSQTPDSRIRACEQKSGEKTIHVQANFPEHF